MEPLPSLLSALRTVDPDVLDQEYTVVRSQTLALKRDLGLTTEAGALKENTRKNRYKDILPYDQSRVVLSLQTKDCNSDYINASYVKGASAGKRYIASQGPLSSTVIDFWRMVWQHNVKVIVMACREIEMGKKKCECYWSPVHQPAAFGPFTVYNQGETFPNEHLVVRTLTVTYQQDSRSLIQYQFLSWPDHDVPYEAAGVLDLLQRARTSQGTHTSPLLVHCSAGCGRTGVICALDYIHDLLVTKRITADFSIKKLVQELRTQRPSAVQTKNQYQFIFTAVTCMFEGALQSPAPPLCRSLSEPKKPEKKTTRTTSSPSKRQQFDMSDTYAVVNKPKHPHPPPPGPTYATVALPAADGRSRSLPSSCHYDNDPAGASAAAPVYSTIRPRAKPLSSAIYDTALPTNHRPEEGPPSLGDSREYHLMPADLSERDDDYEDFTSSVADTPSLCSPGGIGFNCRVQKPRGPRDPPAEWSRVER